MSEVADSDGRLVARVSRGAAWSGASSLVLRGGNLLVTAIVARIVAPREFGVFAVALTVYAIVSNVGELGVSSCLMRGKEDPRVIAPTVATISLVASLALASIMVVLAPPLATALGARDAADPIRVMSLAVVMVGVFAVPSALLVREFQQQRRFFGEIVGFVVGSASLLALVHHGGGAMAFAWSRVAAQLASGLVITMLASARYRPGLDLSKARSLLQFGLPLAGANLVTFTLLNVDYMLVGRMLGADELGIYVLAFNAASWSTALLSAMVNGVAMPAFSRVKDDEHQLRRFLTTTTAAVAGVAAPMCALTLALSQPIVLTLYGPHWAASAAPLTALAAYGAISIICLLFANALVGLGHPRALLALQLVWLATLTPAMYIGIRQDRIVGAGLAHVVVVALVMLPLYAYLLRRATGVQLHALLGPLVRPVAGSAIAGTAAYAASLSFGGAHARLVVGLAAGTAAYLLVMAPVLRRHLAQIRPQSGKGVRGTMRNPSASFAQRLVDAFLWAQRHGVRPPAPLRRGLRVLLRRATSGRGPSPEQWSAPLIAREDLPLRLVLNAGDADPSSAMTDSFPPRTVVTEPDVRCLVMTGSLDVGGMDEVAAFLAFRLPEHGIETAVLDCSLDTSSQPASLGRLGAALLSRGVTVKQLPPTAAAAWAASWQPDVMSAHGAPDWALQLGARLNVPVVETLHGLHTQFGVAAAAEQRRVEPVSELVAVSELVRRQYLTINPSFPPERITTIPNGVDDRRRRPVDHAHARAQLGLGDEFLFVSLARYCLQKNTYALVRAFADVAATHPDAHLLVAGHVEDPAYFAQILKLQRSLVNGDRIHLRTHATRPEVVLSAADGFVLDSFFEGWALASMEALFTGIPVVLSEVGGACEQIGRDGARGFLVGNPLGDPEAVSWAAMRHARYERQPNQAELVDAMRSVVDSRDAWAAARGRLHAESVSRFAPDICLRSHADLLAAMVERRSLHELPA